MMSDVKKTILDTVDDLVSNFLYYDRECDEELPMGAIDKAIEDGVITVEEIQQQFGDSLREGLE